MDYSDYSNFLSRLDTDAENLQTTATSSQGSLSPHDRLSLSPAGTSSATSSLSPESFKFSYDEPFGNSWDGNFIDPDSIFQASWDNTMMPNEGTGPVGLTGNNGNNIKTENSPVGFGAPDVCALFRYRCCSY